MHPRGTSRGQTVTLDIRGKQLAEAAALLTTYPGIEQTAIEQPADNHIRVTIHVAGDAPLGLHPLRLRTARGVTPLALFSVGALPEVTETEPNNDAESAQAITLPVTVNGTITSEDVDVFRFTGAAGQTVKLEVEGMRLGATLFDPHLAMLGPAGHRIGSVDDTRLTVQDPALVVTLPEAGDYTVHLRETAYRGDGNSHYRLHVGAFPRPLVATPSGGQVGQPVEITWLGDSTITTQTVQLPETVASGFKMFPANDAGSAPSPVPFVLSAHPCIMESEPNNNADKANAITIPAGISGRIDGDRDRDWYKFDAKQGQTLNVTVSAQAIGSPLDPIVHIRAGKGKYLAGNDDAGGPDSRLQYTIPSDGTYHVQVHDFLHRSDPLMTYFVEIAPVAPRLSVTINPPDAGMAVPAGNRAAMVLTASRKAFGGIDGSLDIALVDLPAGVVAYADRMPASVAQVPVVLEAAPKASPDGAMARVVARTGGDAPIKGGLRQTIELVELQNKLIYGYDVERLAVAVTKPAPFRIRMGQAMVPLVRRGAASVPVVVERDEGFSADVTVRSVWNPPGVSASTPRLKGDQTEGTLQLDARPNAMVGNWKTALTATATVDGQPITIASPLFTIELAQPYIDFQIAQTRIEQGASGAIEVVASIRTTPEGPTQVELVGLPRGVTTSPQAMAPDATSIRFPIDVAADAPTGRHATPFVRATVPLNGESVRHQSDAGELFIDKPLPPEVAARAAPPKPPEKKESETEPQPDPWVLRREAALQRRAERVEQRKAKAAPEQVSMVIASDS